MRVSRTEPGLIVSAAAHATLLAATLVAFSSPAKFQDVQESVPVEMITDQAFSQISKGEKTAKEVKPVQKADKVADVHELKPSPPVAEAKKDVPLPPPPLKRLPDPGEDDEPKKPEPQKVAALPPPRPEPAKPEPPKLAPEPPPRPEPAKAAPEPPKRPAPPKVEAKQVEKEEPDDAEPVKPAPQPPARPKVEHKPDPKPEPKPEAKAEAKPAPQPPKAPERPRLQTDKVAELLARSKADDKATDKPASRPKSGEEHDQKSKLDTGAIARLLDKDRPQQTGSTGREVVRTASLGTATGTAAKMSPSTMDALNSWMMEQYVRCWNYFGTGAKQKYVPQVRVQFRSDGALAAEPALLNPTADPALTSLATAALTAVRQCNPLRIPSQFAPYYDQWKSRVIAFDPEEMR